MVCVAQPSADDRIDGVRKLLLYHRSRFLNAGHEVSIPDKVGNPVLRQPGLARTHQVTGPTQFEIALRDQEGVILAILSVSDKWTPDKESEAQRVFGTTDDTHPAVDYLFHRAGEVYLGGKVFGIEPPTFYDFKLLRDSPSELRGRFRKLGWRKVVAFQTRNPLHRAHYELTFNAARESDANLLLHKQQGKVAELEKSQHLQPYLGCRGVAHTRWATHGEPNDSNAHPHYSQSEGLAIIHNGIW